MSKPFPKSDRRKTKPGIGIKLRPRLMRLDTYSRLVINVSQESSGVAR